MKSTLGYWTFAVIITLSALVYQRVTGPTNPKRVKVTFENQIVKNKLPRSGDSNTDCKVELKSIPSFWDASLYYREYRSNEKSNKEWIVTPFTSEESNKIFALLPHQDAAGKLEYYIEFKNTNNNSVVDISKSEPIVIRFKDPVPAWALAPHILLIFIAMLFSNLTGIMAAFNHDKFKYYGILTIAFLFVAGFIFGPIVQKYAFGAYWTGFPFGFDLTDNKTLIAFVAWAIAVYFNRNERRPLLSAAAAIVMIIVFSIPHSLRGSELNYETGQVVTGYIPYIRSILPF
ncbi:MAG: hypothetical protein EHM93_09985 [Bacteroidales bacterium]|nr:MAG: hypothetical protein EHM93_09985 [Bacteroidales bacterium]